MAFTLQDLLNAGLPAISTDGNNGNASTQFSRPLTIAEIQTYLEISDPAAARSNSAGGDFAAIPNWATWSVSDFQTWWDANLSDAQVDALAIPAGAKTIMKAQNAAILREGKAIIIMKHRMFPNILG